MRQRFLNTAVYTGMTKILSNYRVRVQFGIVLLILVSLLSSRHLARDTGKSERPLWGSDEISRNDRRFDDLKRILPAGGVVGYIGAVRKGPEDADNKEYLLTQYALSPLIVDNSTNHQIVVGNAPDASSILPVNHDLVLIRDFGNGVFLYRNRLK